MPMVTLLNYKLHVPHSPSARYYPSAPLRNRNSDLSILLSVDPLSDKYPNLSPYTYCAGNPVRLVDKDGRDFEIVVNEEKKTITIKAQYYTENENKESLQKGLDVWNNQSNMYSFVVGHGKNKEKYSIQFELSVAEGDFGTANDAYTAFGKDNSNSANYVEVNGSQQKGETSCGHYIQLEPMKFDRRTMAHEIGHTLGLSEWTFGLMESGGKGMQITRKNIQQILFKANIGHSPSTYSLYNNPLQTGQSNLGNGLNVSNYYKDGYIW